MYATILIKNANNYSYMLLYKIHQGGAQWLETEGLQVRVSSASLCCALEQDTLILKGTT